MSEFEELGWISCRLSLESQSLYGEKFLLKNKCVPPLCNPKAKSTYLSITLKYLWSGFRIRNNGSREWEGGKAQGIWQGDDTHEAACEACMFLFTVFHSFQFQVLQHSTHTLTLCVTG